MKTSTSIGQIALALNKAQKKIGSAIKGSSNPFFKSKYADLGAVLEACKEALNNEGVTILQPHNTTEKGAFVETVLLHESGEWVSSETEVRVAKQNDPQALGSAISYARRYGLQSLVSLPAEDDDGENAMNRVVDSKFSGTKEVKKSTFKKTETIGSNGSESTNGTGSTPIVNNEW